MPQVRCPRCGTVNDTRTPGYPFCLGCQDNLARCGYCQWFDDNTVVCMHPLVTGLFEVSKEATPPCVHHTPRQTIRVRRRGLQTFAWVALAAAVFALGYGVAELFRAPAPVKPAPELELAVEAEYRGAVVGEPYTVTALIYNRSDVVADTIRFEIAEESLAVFYLRDVRPEPTKRSSSGAWRVLTYPDLNPRERRQIALELVPRKSGALHLVVRLISGNNAYHGKCDLPIVVAAGKGGSTSRPPGEGRPYAGQARRNRDEAG